MPEAFWMLLCSEHCVAAVGRPARGSEAPLLAGVPLRPSDDEVHSIPPALARQVLGPHGHDGRGRWRPAKPWFELLMRQQSGLMETNYLRISKNEQI